MLHRLRRRPAVDVAVGDPLHEQRDDGLLATAEREVLLGVDRVVGGAAPSIWGRLPSASLRLARPATGCSTTSNSRVRPGRDGRPVHDLGRPPAAPRPRRWCGSPGPRQSGPCTRCARNGARPPPGARRCGSGPPPRCSDFPAALSGFCCGATTTGCCLLLPALKKAMWGHCRSPHQDHQNPLDRMTRLGQHHQVSCLWPCLWSSQMQLQWKPSLCSNIWCLHCKKLCDDDAPQEMHYLAGLQDDGAPTKT